MEKKKQRSEVSSTEAALLGALAPCVNASTWNTLKLVSASLSCSP
ncbi:unnamed protein product [Brassica rapa subsp. narinosa]